MKTFIFRLFTFFLFLTYSPLCVAQKEVKDMVNRYLQNHYKNTSEMKVYIHTDKHLYESGESVWITALATDRYNLKPLEQNESILVKLFSSKGLEMVEVTIPLEKGIGRGVMHLRDYIKEGKYTLIAYAKKSQELYRQNLVVKRHAIPHFLVNVHFQDKFYAGGETIVIALSVTDYFKNPVKGIGYMCELKKEDTYLLLDKGRLDKTGQVSLTLTLPNPVPRDGIELKVTAQNKIVSEEISVCVPTHSEDVFVFFYPEGGSYVKGLPGSMTIKAYNGKGDDFPFSAVVYNEREEKVETLVSDKSGSAKYNYATNTGEKLKLQITSPYVVNKIFDFPEPKNSGMTLSIGKIANDQIELEASQFPLSPTTCYLGIVNNGELYEIQKFSLTDRYKMAIPLVTLRPGINRFALFNQSMMPVTESLVYISPDKPGAGVEIEFEQKSYKNREKVILNIHNSENLLHAFSASDEYRLNSSEVRNNLPSHLYIGTELEGFPVVNPANLYENNAADDKIHELIKYTPHTDNWSDIYASNGKKTDYQPLLNYRKNNLNDGQISYTHRHDDLLVFTNFSHTNYYLANNPVLAEKLKDLKKTTKKQPYYKEQLRNGVSLRNVIHNMKQYTVIDGKIVFPGTMNSLNFQGGALIILDGVRLGESISVLDQINTFDIEEIFISTNPNDILTYTGLNSVGIIEIKTTRGENEKEKDQEFDDEFKSPDYSKTKMEGSDLRTTIFYSPFRRNATPRGKISFYHSDIRTSVIGRLEGLDENGNPFYSESGYSSFNYSEENQ